MPRVPHLHVPFTLVDGQLLTDEQDSDAELEACAFAVLNTRPGTRVDLPEFGTPDQAHAPVDMDALNRIVAEWDDRIDLHGMRQSGALADVMDRVDRVRVSIGPGSEGQ